ncbi:hypothetical protein [Kitasatospora sp. NPDC088783]|uniref:hypothetical protein n=1 Tax=Kitasatospora sp. NPDC088783 TaxID=3364077 RepID=UPI0037F7BD10
MTTAAALTEQLRTEADKARDFAASLIRPIEAFRTQVPDSNAAAELLACQAAQLLEDLHAALLAFADTPADQARRLRMEMLIRQLSALHSSSAASSICAASPAP